MSENTYKESSVLVEFGTRKPVLVEDFRSPEEYWQDEAHNNDKEIDRLTAQLEQANKDLEKYKGAVEVEGIIHIISEDSIKNGISILSPISMKYNRQRVKVLVMPMEVE